MRRPVAGFGVEVSPMSEKKINLLDLDRKAMRALFAEMGEK
ncbi:MAG: bifunctional tRNA (adenosine(37)-C2)-methyltransferase TrmG/ribosomal RNA large subunit methyltransferase RlmN, partial [Shewanella sp.]